MVLIGPYANAILPHRRGETVKRGEMAISSNPGIATTECAAYGSPQALQDFGGNHDYELVDDGKAVHIQSTRFDRVEDPDSDIYENEEGAYEIIPW